MRTNPFGTRLTSIGAYGVLAQRWDNVRASAEAARGHRCRAGRAHLPVREIIAKCPTEKSFRGFVFWVDFPNRLIDIDRLHQKNAVFLFETPRILDISNILIEHPVFLEPIPYHGFYFIV